MHAAHPTQTNIISNLQTKGRRHWRNLSIIQLNVAYKNERERGEGENERTRKRERERERGREGERESGREGEGEM